MSKIRFEELLPEEILMFQKTGKPIYISIGSLEWHSLHMSMGMDTFHAEAIALELASKTGGIVYPPVYAGTESYRTKESLNKLGFTEKDRIRGMDFPSNLVSSCYWPPDLFKSMIRWQVWWLCEIGFDKIVLLNGHGADIQKQILDEICVEFHETEKKVVNITVLFPECGVGLGHAGLAETSIMMAIKGQCVDLRKLPSKPCLLNYQEYGMADSGGNEKGYFMKYDPRDATADIGEELIEYEVKRCLEILKEKEII
jgi:creatinine amidohydrolase